MDYRRKSAAAAVAGDDERENDEPDPVIVKQVAQAVVHNRYLLADWQGSICLPFLLSEYVESEKKFRKKSEPVKKRVPTFSFA